MITCDPSASCLQAGFGAALLHSELGLAKPCRRLVGHMLPKFPTRARYTGRVSFRYSTSHGASIRTFDGPDELAYYRNAHAPVCREHTYRYARAAGIEVKRASLQHPQVRRIENACK